MNRETLELKNAKNELWKKYRRTIFTPDMIKMKLLNLNVNKSVGPDNIHPYMLKTLVEFISKPSAILFNKSMESGTTPEKWADIHKKRVRNIVITITQ